MNRLSLALVGAGILGLGACAPRIKSSHYDRWTQQDTIRKQERAEEERKEAAFKAFTAGNGGKVAVGAKPGGPAVSNTAAPPPPPPPAGYDGYNSLGGSPTPPVKTATKSRAVKPAEDEDIY